MSIGVPLSDGHAVTIIEGDTHHDIAAFMIRRARVSGYAPWTRMNAPAMGERLRADSVPGALEEIVDAEDRPISEKAGADYPCKLTLPARGRDADRESDISAPSSAKGSDASTFILAEGAMESSGWIQDVSRSKGLLVTVGTTWPYIAPLENDFNQRGMVLWGTGDLAFTGSAFSDDHTLGSSAVYVFDGNVRLSDGLLVRTVRRTTDVLVSDWWHVPQHMQLLRAVWARGAANKLIRLISDGDVNVIIGGEAGRGRDGRDKGKASVICDCPLPVLGACEGLERVGLTVLPASVMQDCWYSSHIVDNNEFCGMGPDGNVVVPLSWVHATFARPTRLPPIYTCGHGRLPEVGGKSCGLMVAYKGKKHSVFLAQLEACYSGLMIVAGCLPVEPADSIVGRPGGLVVIDRYLTSAVMALDVQISHLDRDPSRDFTGTVEHAITTVVGQLLTKASAGLPVSIEAISAQTRYDDATIVASLCLSRWDLPTTPTGESPFAVLNTHTDLRHPHCFLPPYSNGILHGSIALEREGRTYVPLLNTWLNAKPHDISPKYASSPAASCATRLRGGEVGKELSSIHYMTHGCIKR